MIGLPGYPVAAYLALEWFVRPLVDGWFGVPALSRRRLRVRLEEDVKSKEGREDFVRVNIARVGDRYVARSLPRGAGSTCPWSGPTACFGSLRTAAPWRRGRRWKRSC